MYGNYINRNTIYLTGASSNKYAKSPYLNNNMNYTGISYNNNLSNRKHKNSYNNYLNMNNSSHSFFINNNIDNTYGNIYQRQVMQLPPNEQPLFYETKSNIKDAYVTALNVIKKSNMLGIVLEIDEFIQIKEVWYFEKFLIERFHFSAIDMTIKYQKDIKKYR